MGDERRTDDARIDRIEQKLDREIEASATFRGELRSFMLSSDNFTTAVSAKAGAAKLALEAHMADPAAHPALTLAQRDKLDGKVLGWMGVIGSLSGIVGGLVHKFFGATGGIPPNGTH